VTRTARLAAAAAIARIYNEGIEDRIATFETEPRAAEDIAAWLEDDLPLVVVESEGDVDGEWRDVVIVERLPGD
jgi:phosphinothricin acetyltransferase